MAGEARERGVELIRFLALLADDPRLRCDYLGWAARLRRDPDERLHPSELELLRHPCHDRLTELQAAVVQDEPLPGEHERDVAGVERGGARDAVSFTDGSGCSMFGPGRYRERPPCPSPTHRPASSPSV
jgi:hypothetical protein